MRPEDVPFDSHSLAFVEGLYHDYVRDPSSVSDDWRKFFATLAGRDARFLREPHLGPSSPRQGLVTGAAASTGAAGATKESAAVLQERVDQLVRAYRVRGHRIAKLDPLGEPPALLPELDPAGHGL